jgi:hypothetical protein
MWEDCINIVNGRGTLDEHWTGAVYPMKLQPAPYTAREEPRNTMFFHFAMWLSVNPLVRDFRMLVDGAINENPVSEVRSHPLWVIFAHQRDRTAFTKWFKQYKTWFGDKDASENFLPEFPKGGRHTFTVVETDLMRSQYDPSYGLGGSFPDGFAERWTWVLEHCLHQVVLAPHAGLAFKNEKEAVHFKLRWC